VTTVAEIVAWLDRIAPRRLAESWDNVGLLWGDPEQSIERVMTCLTVTPGTAAEAIEQGAGLIVSHHPVLFRPAQRVVARKGDPGAYLWALARAGVAVASPHTAYDNAEGGINDQLARCLGLTEVACLRPSAAADLCKVVVFAPESDRSAVLDAAFAAGAGRIGDYRECSFGSTGTGTFFGEPGTNPTVGQAGRREEAPEWRLEVICPKPALGCVLEAIRGAHSYEEPAIDVYPLTATARDEGAGRIGTLPAAESLGALAAKIAQLLDAPGLQYAGDPDRPVRRLAIACGAGDDFLDDAWGRADALLTGEARYHRAIAAEALGIGLIVAGHHATERPGVEALADRLARMFADLTVWASRVERDPLRRPGAGR
jgi:dinuclear metal center YbgI/SA1388 family protein